MNKRRLRQVAELVETSRSFDMGSHCNCVAAEALRLEGGDPSPLPWASIKSAAQLFLGLSNKQATDLFCPTWLNRNYYDLDRRQDAKKAAKVLRRLADVGKIIWR